MRNTFSNLSFYRLDKKHNLSSEDLKRIAELIYQTDPYIYPAVFLSQDNAIKVIPEMIVTGDRMFCSKNIFVTELDSEIAGIVLWHQGELFWTTDHYEKVIDKLQIPPSPYIELVNKVYFRSYSNTRSDIISIINVCIFEKHRGVGIGSALIEAFLQETAGLCREYELFVLADNKNAVKLYMNYGFHVSDTINGFSVDQIDLPCYRMIKLCY